MELQSKELSLLLVTDSKDIKRTITGLFNDQTLFSVSPVSRFLKRTTYLAKVYFPIDYIIIDCQHIQEESEYNSIINIVKSKFPNSRILIIFDPFDNTLIQLDDREDEKYYFISKAKLSDQLRTFIKEKSGVLPLRKH